MRLLVQSQKIPIGKLDVKGFSKKILQKVPRFLEKIYYMYKSYFEIKLYYEELV